MKRAVKIKKWGLSVNKSHELQELETPFQKQITDLADIFRWRWYHTHDSRRSNKGFPDLCMVRGDRLIFAEVKTEKGPVTPEQKEWLEELRKTKNEVYLWRPSDWKSIEDVLR